MTVPVLTFFNNKGGVGKTSLVYHLAWMLSDLGYRVLACDLDPQANLTAAFLGEDQLEKLWDDGNDGTGKTIMQCIKPLTEAGDIRPPVIVEIQPGMALIPGDLALAEFEGALSAEWPNAAGTGDLHRVFRVSTAFSAVLQDGAKQMDASVILADVGSNFGAINRSALIATDFIVVPLAADLFSLRGLHNLGPTLNRWRGEWKQLRDNREKPEFMLPNGDMKPIGYVVRQHSVRLARPVKANDKWVNRMPEEYARHLLGKETGPYPETPAQDKTNALATVKHYRSLAPLAREARKPVFHLTTADGAIGSHAAAAKDARRDFAALAKKIAEKIKLNQP